MMRLGQSAGLIVSKAIFVHLQNMFENADESNIMESVVVGTFTKLS